MTTQIASKPLELGNPVTKSMEIFHQGHSGIGKGWRTPYGRWREALVHWQVWQFATYGSTSFCRVGQKYRRLIRSQVLACPGCPVAGMSWWLWSIHNCRASSTGTYSRCWYNRQPSYSWHSDRDMSQQCCFPSCSVVRIFWAKALDRVAFKLSWLRGS
jgi:hypothetical protein